MPNRWTLLAAAFAAVAISACGGGGSSSKTAAPASPVATATPEAPGGDVYFFGNGRVAILDATTGATETTITSGLEGITSWDDTVRSADGARLYVSVHSKNEVLVFDTAKRALLTSIAVGANPVHLTLVNNGKELWSHSDAEGTFYVIDAGTLTVVDKIDASSTHSGHGALAAPAGSANYYATNVNAPALFVIDAQTRKVTKTLPLCKGPDGSGGTHGIGYSAASHDVYVQCSGALTQVAVVDTLTNAVVKYLDTTGDIYASADGAEVAVANSKTNTLDFIDTTSSSPEFTSVPIPNRAASAYFATLDGKTVAYVADLKSPDVEVVDVAAKKIEKTIPGVALPGQGPDTIVPRGSDIGGGLFYTVVRPTGVLNIIDEKTLAIASSSTIDGGFEVAYAGHPAAP